MESLTKRYMSISTQKSNQPAVLTARVPQRQRGKLRVAALMKSGAAVFAERGYEAATMTEIAARAGAPIGSLYQFFPSKEALGDALLSRYRALVDDSLRAIEERAAELSIPALADTLLGLFAGLREERTAAIALLDARRDLSVQRLNRRLEIRRHIARILMIRTPGLLPKNAENVAAILIQLMKAVVALTDEPGLEFRAAALAELHDLARLYLVDRLKQKSRC